MLKVGSMIGQETNQNCDTNNNSSSSSSSSSLKQSDKNKLHQQQQQHSQQKQQQFINLETSSFTFGAFEWSLTIVPLVVSSPSSVASGSNPTPLAAAQQSINSAAHQKQPNLEPVCRVYLNRLTGFDSLCRVKYRVILGHHNQQQQRQQQQQQQNNNQPANKHEFVDSKQLDQISDCGGRIRGYQFRQTNILRLVTLRSSSSNSGPGSLVFSSPSAQLASGRHHHHGHHNSASSRQSHQTYSSSTSGTNQAHHREQSSVDLRVHIEMFCANTISEAKVSIQRKANEQQVANCIDRNKQAWCIESDNESGETVRLKLFFLDIQSVPRNHIRYISWIAYLVRRDTKSGQMRDSLAVKNAPHSNYYLQDGMDMGTIMDTDIPVKELNKSPQSYLAEGNQLTVHIEWVDSLLLFSHLYNNYDALATIQRHQTSRELEAVQMELEYLERKYSQVSRQLAAAQSSGSSAAVVAINQSTGTSQSKEQQQQLLQLVAITRSAAGLAAADGDAGATTASTTVASGHSSTSPPCDETQSDDELADVDELPAAEAKRRSSSQVGGNTSKHHSRGSKVRPQNGRSASSAAAVRSRPFEVGLGGDGNSNNDPISLLFEESNRANEEKCSSTQHHHGGRSSSWSLPACNAAVSPAVATTTSRRLPREPQNVVASPGRHLAANTDLGPWGQTQLAAASTTNELIEFRRTSDGSSPAAGRRSLYTNSLGANRPRLEQVDKEQRQHQQTLLGSSDSELLNHANFYPHSNEANNINRRNLAATQATSNLIVDSRSPVQAEVSSFQRMDEQEQEQHEEEKLLYPAQCAASRRLITSRDEMQPAFYACHRAVDQNKLNAQDLEQDQDQDRNQEEEEVEVDENRAVCDDQVNKLMALEVDGDQMNNVDSPESDRLYGTPSAGERAAKLPLELSQHYFNRDYPSSKASIEQRRSVSGGGDSLTAHAAATLDLISTPDSRLSPLLDRLSIDYHSASQQRVTPVLLAANDHSLQTERPAAGGRLFVASATLGGETPQTGHRQHSISATSLDQWQPNESSTIARIFGATLQQQQQTHRPRINSATTCANIDEHHHHMLMHATRTQQEEANNEPLGRSFDIHSSSSPLHHHGHHHHHQQQQQQQQMFAHQLNHQNPTTIGANFQHQSSIAAGQMHLRQQLEIAPSTFGYSRFTGNESGGDY